MRKVGLLLSLAALGAVLGSPAHAQPKAQCRARSPAVSVTRDARFHKMFGAYGNDNTLLDDWTGADGDYSVKLPDGRVAWDFGDTFLGYVNPDGSRPPGQPFINNDLVIQDGRALVQTLHGGTASNPTSLVVPTDGSTWYWPSAMAVEGSELRVFLAKFLRTGPGPWDWEWTGTDIGSWTLPDFAFLGTTAAPWENGVAYGTGVLTDGGYTYVYGVEDLRWHNYLHVARVPQGGLLGQWEFLTASGWSTDPMATKRTLDGIGTSLGIVKIGPAYVLITYDGNVPFGSEIVLYTSCQPFGPWEHRTHVYTTPESRGDTWTYNAKVHPEFTDGSGLLVSYDVNSSKWQNILDHVDLYRPKFIRVGLAFA